MGPSPGLNPATTQLLGQKVGPLGLAPWEGSGFLCIFSGNTWHFCLPWAQTYNSSLVCPIVCAFSSKEFTTPSCFWARGLDASPRISSELKREGGWETSLWALDSLKGEGRH